MTFLWGFRWHFKIGCFLQAQNGDENWWKNQIDEWDHFWNTSHQNVHLGIPFCKSRTSSQSVRDFFKIWEVMNMLAVRMNFEKHLIAFWFSRKEIHQITIISYMKGILLSMIIIHTRLSIFITILSYVLMGGLITAEKVWTAVTRVIRILADVLDVNCSSWLSHFF